MLAKAPPSTSHTRLFTLSCKYNRSLEASCWGTEATNGVPPCRFPFGRVVCRFGYCNTMPLREVGIWDRRRWERFGLGNGGNRVRMSLVAFPGSAARLREADEDARLTCFQTLV